MRTCVTHNRKSPSSPNHPQNCGRTFGMPLPRAPIRQQDRNRRSTSPHKYDLRRRRSSQSEELDYEPECAAGLEENVDVVSVDGVMDYNALRQRVALETKKLNDCDNKTLHAAQSGGERKQVPQQQSLCTYQILGVLFLVALLGIVLFFSFPKETIDNAKDLRENILDNMRIISETFPSQKKNVWMNFLYGITKVLIEKPTEPSVFLLIHQDAETTSCLARKVGQVAHHFLNTSKPDPLIVDGVALSQNAAMVEDYGLLIKTYRPLVEEHRIMILDNLQSVPATLARGLHIFCDNVTPLVNEAVYIFTLNVGSGNGESNPTKVAERELHSLWGQLDTDTLTALIVRLTGGSVFRIQSEANVPSAC